MAIWNVAKYYLLTVQKRRSRTVCRSSITKYNNEVKVHALSLKFSSALFSHLDLGEKTILSINVDKMEEVSQHSQVSHDSCIGNIETGLSADDSLALAQSKPDVSHVLPSQEIQKKSGWKSTLLPWRAWILVVMFAILIIIVVAVVVSRDKPEDISRAPDDNVFNQQDGLLESSRLESLREMLVPVSGIAILTDPTTPQYAALEWLADEDPALLDLKETDFETISDRYKVALLYFSSSGSNWRRQHHFLSETSICEWNDGGAGGAFEGIRCENNEVVEITLGAIQPEKVVARL